MRPSPVPAAKPTVRELGESVGQIHPMTAGVWSQRQGGPVHIVARVPRVAVVALLRLYQRVVSPLYGPSCRFYPSCSQYAMLAVERHGALKGSGLALWRVLRCNPWNPGGVDDVPSRGGRLESGACDHEPGAGTTTTDRREGL